MFSYDPDRTVAEILRLKTSSIRSAALPTGTPAWSELLGWTWSEVEDAASRGDPGMRTIRKLLSDSRFNR